jgi:hypothetical protein
LASERAALLADICARLEAARRAGDRARFPGSSWGQVIRALAYRVQDPDEAFHFAAAASGMASGSWDADARDYVNYLLTLTADLRRQRLAALPTENLWEILLLLAER